MATIDAEILSQNPTRLNEQQLQMLQLFKTPMPNEEYEKIKNYILQIKNQRLQDSIAQWEAENNITAETYDTWSKEHMRTPYKRLP